MFHLLHGLGYFQSWFRGMFEQDGARLQGDIVDRSISTSPLPTNPLLSRSFSLSQLPTSTDVQRIASPDVLAEISHLVGRKLETRVAVELWLTNCEKWNRVEMWLTQCEEWQRVAKNKSHAPARAILRSSSSSYHTAISDSRHSFFRVDAVAESDIRIDSMTDIVPWDRHGNEASSYVGSGCYGTVKICRYRRTLQPIAVKDFSLALDLVPADRLPAFIQHEADELEAACHGDGADFFPRFHGLLRPSPSKAVIAMEFVGDHETGKTWSLSHALIFAGEIDQQGDSTWPDIVLDIVSGIDELHSRGKLFNDVKPDNIMLFRCPRRDRWAAKIIDFALVSEVDRPRKYNFDDMDKDIYRRDLDFWHLAPEIVLEGAPTSYASDIFSVGYLLKMIVERKNVACLEDVWAECMHQDAEQRPCIRVLRYYLEEVSRVLKKVEKKVAELTKERLAELAKERSDPHRLYIKALAKQFPEMYRYVQATYGKKKK